MRSIVAALALSVVVACGGDSPTTARVGAAGTYTLRTVDGAALPYIIFQAGEDKAELIDDAITLNNAGTFTESGHARVTIEGRVTTESTGSTGTFTLTGTAITLRTPDGINVSGTLSNNTLTLAQDGRTAVFAK